MAFNILIVDDSTTTRGMVKKVLKLTGLELGEILEASNGLKGLEVLRQNWVDLVLADLNMPEMTGQAMIEEMLKDPMLSQVPVIVVSSEGDQKVISILFEKGVKDFIRKPFDANTLRNLVEKALAPAPA
jgi:two-component system, chemotaxis family, chemotaxis protein CheY